MASRKRARRTGFRGLFLPSAGRARDSRAGFTLVEVMVAVVLLGFGISAVLYGMGVGHNITNEGRAMLVAGDLAAYVKQYTKGLSFLEPGSGECLFGPEAGESEFRHYDDIDDLNGLLLSPAISADGSQLSAYTGWSQHIIVTSLDPETLAELELPDGGTVKRVEVEVFNGPRRVGLYQWIVTDR